MTTNHSPLGVLIAVLITLGISQLANIDGFFLADLIIGSVVRKQKVYNFTKISNTYPSDLEITLHSINPISMVNSNLWRIKIGFPLHFTVKVVPSAIPSTSNSAEANASTSAEALILATNCT